MRTLLAVAALLVATTASTEAQLFAARDNPVAYGHHHINATDVDEHKSFWIDALGGRQVELGDYTVIAFPNVMVFLSEWPRLVGRRGRS